MDASLNVEGGIHFVLGQYRIILSADTASEVRQPPERCLSRQAGIVRCCLSLKFCRYFSTSVGNGLDRSGAFGRISLVEYYL